MIVRFTKRAAGHVARIDSWWREHRGAAPQLFFQELSDALALIEANPDIGRRYGPKPAVRRWLLRATRYHVYYRLGANGVTVVAVWSAVRGRKAPV